MRRLRTRVRAFARRHKLLPRDGHVLVAVSGGADSSVLLDVLSALAPARGARLSALHIDHGARPGGDAETAAVASLAARLGVPFRSRRLDVGGRAGEAISEDSLRRARLEAFRVEARDTDADCVATGHTADDQAETLLLRLGRGTGPRGLAGIWPRRCRLDGLCLVRPLLAERRAAIASYAAAAGIVPVLDPTNEEPVYLRNRVRRELLPDFERLFGEGVVERLAVLADVMRDEQAACAQWAAATEGTSWWRGDNTITVDLNAFRLLPRARQRRLLRHQLEVLGLEAGVYRRHLDALVRLAGRPTGGGGTVDLPDGLRAERSYDTLIVTRSLAGTGNGKGPRARHATTGAARLIEKPGVHRLGSLSLTVELRDEAPADPRAAANEAWVAAQDGLFPLALRGVRPGERIELPGGGGHRKVSRLLVDRKVPRTVRHGVRLLVDSTDHPLWVIVADGTNETGGIPPAGGALAAGGHALMRTAVRRVAPGRGPVALLHLGAHS